MNYAGLRLKFIVCYTFFVMRMLCARDIHQSLTKQSSSLLQNVTIKKFGLFLLPFRSNLNLSKYFYDPQLVFLVALKNRLRRHGSPRGLDIFENFLIFLKWEYNVNPCGYLRKKMFSSVYLPFQLYTVKFSNRNYMFPGPLSTLGASRVVLKILNRAIPKQKELTFLNKFFVELSAYFLLDSESFLYRTLESLINQGFENRAYIHYRWLLKR